MIMLFPSEVVWGEVCFSVCIVNTCRHESACELEALRDTCTHRVFTVTPAASFWNTQTAVNTSAPVSLRQWILMFTSG